jgi:cell wall-associated NlpC family hydrolase
MRRPRASLAALVLAGCSVPPVYVHTADGGGADLGAAEEGDPLDGGNGSLGGATLTPGGTARVTAQALNLRNGIGTSATILTAMPCGSQVSLVAGPSTTPAAGWWNVTYAPATGSPLTGWASGTYLVASAAFTASICGGGGDGGAIASGDGGVADIFALAKLAVGYSYYWGHGSWRSDGTQLGSCSGSCPNCAHAGQYGADCSGFVAKAWQVPSASPIELDAHPFSTANFYSDQVYWKQVPRSTLQPADALVHRTATEGHVVLYESGSDPFGNVWLYEARGCATGVVHDLRTLDSTYIAIRRN